MIIVRSPMRISLGGGGTDLPSYADQFGGFCITAALDKYVYITLHETFQQEIIVKYSKMERVKLAEEIEHPIVREVLKRHTGNNVHWEIVSHADIPAGTGLGSSSAFTAALLATVWHDRKWTPYELADEACFIEIDWLKQPIGKQDQYATVFGGLKVFRFEHRQVIVGQLLIDSETLADLEDGLMLFFTGYSRSASAVLADQADKIDNLHQTKEIGLQICRALERGDLQAFAELMDAHWQYKKLRSGKISNERIDEWYEIGKRHGAIGGKLVGAGGGGFLLFYTRDRQKLRHAMLNCGLKEVRFRFDHEGTKVIAQ